MNDRRWELFRCQQCGICCTDIELPYDPRNLEKMAAFLGLTVDQVIEKYYGKISDDGKSIEFDENKRKPCPFLITISDGKKSCSIHQVKPENCFLFPFDSTGTLDCPVAAVIIRRMQEEDS